jgi:hypothetical protein
MAMRAMMAMMAIGVAALITATPACAQDGSLGWMSGAWCTVPEGSAQTCEVWSQEVAGGIAGLSSTRKDGAEVSSEHMAIGVSQGRLTFVAQPSDAAAPTRFPMVSRGPTELVFENRDHDYPQRIRYWREGDVLMAEISLADGGKPMRWRYLRVKQ